MRREAIFKYALKSVFRQKSRNAFIIFIVCLTSVFSLFTSSLFEGKNHQIRKNIIETETGHFQVIDRNFYQKYDPLSPLEMTDEIWKAVAGYKFTPELILKTTILHPEGASELTLLGIYPLTHEEIFGLASYVEGKWPLVTGPEVVIGENFALKMKLDIGDQLVITYQDRNAGIQNESLTIVGIFHNYGQGFERTHAYVSKTFIQNLLKLPGESPFHRLIVHAPSADIKPAKHKSFFIRTWDQLHPELTVMMQFHNGVTSALIIFMLVIAYVSIITPVNVLWDERKSEVNLLQTLGSSSKTLYLLAIFEAMVLTFFALILSLIIWGAIHYISSKHGLDFSLIGERTVIRGGILISSIVYPVISWKHTIFIIAFHAVLIFGCQLWCIRKLMKNEAIRD